MREPREPTTRLTARQLEALLLARDGLMQAEIASCMGISSRQVERLLHDARERVGAAARASEAGEPPSPRALSRAHADRPFEACAQQ